LTRGWQSLPTTDDGHESDDDDSADEQQQLTKSSSLNGIIKSSSTLEPWRIIVNPVAEQHQLSIGSFGRTRSLTTFDTNDCNKRQYAVHQSIGQNRRLMDRSGFSGDQYRQMILNTVDQLYGKNKVLSVSEAQSIALALDMKELSSDFMLRLLTVIANSAAFTVNQVYIIKCPENMLNLHITSITNTNTFSGSIATHRCCPHTDILTRSEKSNGVLSCYADAIDCKYGRQCGQSANVQSLFCFGLLIRFC
jgi:hypothetical protein